MEVPLDARLRAGVAVFNDGYYHAAHDAWEPAYREATGEQRDFLQGLIQYTAAVYHVAEGNSEGAQGLAKSALDYLDSVDDRGINLNAVREWLRICRDDYQRVASDPTPKALTVDANRLQLTDLTYPAAAVAAPLIAEVTGHDAEIVAAGAEYALADLAAEEATSPFVTFVLDFLRSDQRALVVTRLAGHVERRRAREADVEGLFD